MTEAAALYSELTAAAAPGRDSFDTHCLASVIAIAATEGRPLEAGLGLSTNELNELIAAWFPGARLGGVAADAGPCLAADELPADELRLRELLEENAGAPGAMSRLFAAIIARRARRQRHLWQDLGLRDRMELKRLMARHFAPLVALNKKDMRWKKFFSRTLCQDGSFPICVAPSCGECDDFRNCFGAEEGESLLL